MNGVKRQINYQKLTIVLIVVILILTGCSLIKKTFNELTNEEKYIASSDLKVTIYTTDLSESIEVPRGIKVIKLNEKLNNETYEKIKYNDKKYLINTGLLVNKLNEVVLEKKLYVRTPVTVFKDLKTSNILSLIKKGEEVEIIGFDELNADGSVNKYKVKYNDIEGYVYGKYLVSTKELALLNYDAENNYLIHSKRGNTLGGGSAANLDYYPYPKVKFEDNVMPEEVRSLYLNTNTIRNVDEYITLAKENNINALVIDIKDNTTPGYDSQVMKKYSPTNYAKAHNKTENYRQAIQKIKDAGLYAIGRITVFKDSYFVTDHPESAISDTSTGEPFLHNSSYWPSAFDRLVWEFNVELAKEAVSEFGFNEIQFDYVRFPDRVYNLEKDGRINMKNKYDEEKAQAIQGFLMYATDEIHNLGAYISADVFGESAHIYVTGYGQYWGAISNIVDVISAMPYPDHFNADEYGFEEIVWTVPYKLLKFWGENYVVKRQTEIPTPAVVRTWIQAYNAIRPPYIEYDAKLVEEQIRGLYEAGLTGGYMTWNSASSLSKYKTISPAFKINYLEGL